MGFNLKYSGRASLSANVLFDTLTRSKHLESVYEFWHINFFNSLIPKLLACGIVTKKDRDPGGMRSKLSLSFTLPTPLESKRSTLPSVQLSPAWVKGSNKTDQDFKVGILNED